MEVAAFSVEVANISFLKVTLAAVEGRSTLMEVMVHFHTTIDAATEPSLPRASMVTSVEVTEPPRNYLELTFMEVRKQPLWCVLFSLPYPYLYSYPHP